MKCFKTVIFCCLIAIMVFPGCSKNSSADSNIVVEGSSVAADSLSTDSSMEVQENIFIENGKEFYREGTKIAVEPVTITGFGAKYSGNAEWDDEMLVWKELEERTGINVEMETVVNTEARTKALTLFAADDLPGILMKNAINMSDVTKFAKSGQLVNLKPFMDAGLMPNFTKLYNEDVNLRIALTTDDGGVYCLPAYYPDDSDRVRRFMYINEKWLERVGLEKPTTLDELLTVLRAFRDQDANGNGDPNDEYPITFGDAIGQTERTARALAGIDNVFDNPFNVVDGELKQMYTSENMKESWKFLHTLYSEGLLEQDLFTRSAPEFFARLANDQYGVSLLLPTTDSSQFGVLLPTFNIIDGVDTIWNWKVSPLLGVACFSITKSNPYPQATARWIDYLYGQEGATLVRMGVEGDTYVTNPDGSLSYSDKVKNDEQGVEFAMGKYTFWLGPNACPGCYTARETLPLWEGTLQAEIIDDFEPFLTENTYNLPVLDSSTEKERQRLLGEINKYYGEARAQFMTGKLDFEEDWDSYVSTMESLGLERLEEIYQEAFDVVKSLM